jgi:Flp pilus assembly protein TadD
MQCLKCDSENSANAKFCRGCGKKLEGTGQVTTGGLVECPKCGHANEPGKKFCPKCGASQVVAAPTPAAPAPSHPPATPRPMASAPASSPLAMWGPVNSPATAPLQPDNAATHSPPAQQRMNKAVVGVVIVAVLLATAGGGGYWYYQKQEAEKANVSSQTVNPQSATNPTMTVLAMIGAAKSGNNAAILSAKVALDSFPKPGRGDRKLAREKNKLGLDALKVNMYESAITRLNEGVAADPSDVEVKNNLGYALMMAGRLDDAKRTLIESLALDSARAAAWANLGQTLAMQGDEDSAVAAFVNTFIFSRAQNKTVEFLTNLSQSDSNQRVKSAAAKALETPLIKATDTSPRTAPASSLPSFPKSTLYRDARKQLTSLGWRPVTLPDAQKCQNGDTRCENFTEMWACAGTGQAACRFTWKRNDLLVQVIGVGEGDQPVDSVVLCRSGRCEF